MLLAVLFILHRSVISLLALSNVSDSIRVTTSTAFLVPGPLDPVSTWGKSQVYPKGAFMHTIIKRTN